MKKIPLINWCTRCVYPSSSAVPLYFDKDGVCIGCITAEEKKSINWSKRKKMATVTWCTRKWKNFYNGKFN